MPFRRCDLAVVNRTLSPDMSVVAQGLLMLAKSVASARSVLVVFQNSGASTDKCDHDGMFGKLYMRPSPALSNSASSIAVRIVDAVFFTSWVFSMLVWYRPRVVYVATDPPVVVPFIVMVYCWLLHGKYVYHLQDIHPEAASVITHVRPSMMVILKAIDSVTMRRAFRIVTITDVMASVIYERSHTLAPILLIDNPSASVWVNDEAKERIRGFSFCGNIGRLQRIPLMCDAIRQYLSGGGQLNFVFAGGGVFVNKIKELADQFEQVRYYGHVSVEDAARICCDCEWALLPIEDGVTRFAFPSKSSSYVAAGAKILAICGNNTSVSKWISVHNVGITVKPEVESIVAAFESIEAHQADVRISAGTRKILMDQLSVRKFSERLYLSLFGDDEFVRALCWSL